MGESVTNRQSIRRTIFLLLAVLVCAVGAYGATEWRKAALQDADDAEIAARNHTYRIGETITLSSKEDALPLPSGTSYEAVFDWEGTMELTVISARLYPTREEAYADYPDGPCWFNWGAPRSERVSNDALVACTFTVRNIDAAPRSETKRGKEWFNVTYLIRNEELGPGSYFDGIPPEGDAGMGESTWYYVAPGDEQTFTIMFPTEKLEGEHLYVHVGVNGSAREKYRINLGVEA